MIMNSSWKDHEFQLEISPRPSYFCRGFTRRNRRPSVDFSAIIYSL